MTREVVENSECALSRQKNAGSGESARTQERKKRQVALALALVVNEK